MIRVLAGMAKLTTIVTIRNRLGLHAHPQPQMHALPDPFFAPLRQRIVPGRHATIAHQQILRLLPRLSQAHGGLLEQTHQATVGREVLPSRKLEKDGVFP